MSYHKYVKIKPETSGHQAILNQLEKESEIKEKVNEFAKTYDLERYRPTVNGRSLILCQHEHELHQRFKGQIVNHYAYVFFKFRKGSPMYETWESYRQKHRLTQPSAKRFLKKYCILDDFQWCHSKIFKSNETFYIELKMPDNFELNPQFLTELSKDEFVRDLTPSYSNIEALLAQY